MRRARARKAQALEAEGRVGELLAAMGVDDEPAAHEALQERLAFAQAMTRLLEAEVSRLDPAHGDGREAIYGPDHLGDARPHALMVLLREWAAETARLAKMALDHDIDAAKLRLEAADVDALVGVFAEALAGAGLSREQEQAVRRSIGEQLRVLAERVPG